MTVRCASWLPTFAALGLALGVAACDGGASAVKAPKAGDVASAAVAASDRDPPSYEGAQTARPDPRDAPVRKIAGKPMMAGSRNRLNRNGRTARGPSGPPRLNRTTASFLVT